MDNEYVAPPAGRGWGITLLVLLPVAFSGSCFAVLEGDIAPLGAIVAIAYAIGCIGVLRLPSRLGKWSAVIGLATLAAGAVIGRVADGFSMQRGRALRRKGRARVPSEARDTGWCEPLPRLEAPPEAADGWRANAATETASVAAFSHLAQQLLALGAPSRLVAEAHADALDEVRHARLCYGLAQAIDGAATGPAAFPAAVWPADEALSYRSLAVDCLVESCLLESASARVAARLAVHPELDATIREVLEIIAREEAVHAEHGYSIVHWCLENDASIRPALDETLSRFDASAMSGIGRDDLEAFGLAGPALWSACVAEARADVVRRLGFRDMQRLAA